MPPKRDELKSRLPVVLNGLLLLGLCTMSIAAAESAGKVAGAVQAARDGDRAKAPNHGC